MGDYIGDYYRVFQGGYWELRQWLIWVAPKFSAYYPQNSRPEALDPKPWRNSRVMLVPNWGLDTRHLATFSRVLGGGIQQRSSCCCAPSLTGLIQG